MRVRVRCMHCRHVQELEREFAAPGLVRLVCHFCEARIEFSLKAGDFAQQPARAWRA